MNDASPIPAPTVEGFTAWIYAVMGVPVEALPVDSVYIQLAYDTSVNLVYTGLTQVPNMSLATPKSPSIYAIAVYNLGGHILCQIAQDIPPSTFWADLRDKLQMNVMSYGMVNSASDQGTSASQQIPDQIANLTLMGLDMLKSPWGRMYLMIAGQWGTLWGIS